MKTNLLLIKNETRKTVFIISTQHLTSVNSKLHTNFKDVYKEKK